MLTVLTAAWTLLGERVTGRVAFLNEIDTCLPIWISHSCGAGVTDSSFFFARLLSLRFFFSPLPQNEMPFEVEQNGHSSHRALQLLLLQLHNSDLPFVCLTVEVVSDLTAAGSFQQRLILAPQRSLSYSS